MRIFRSLLARSSNGTPAGPILVESDLCKRMIGATAKRARGMIPILAGIQISKNGSDATATLAATDLQAPTVCTVVADPNRLFPVLERVMPKTDRPSLTVVLASDVLADILKSAQAVKGGKHMQTIRFDVPSEPKHFTNGQCHSAIRIQITGEEVEVIGAVMPCRV
jgi:hypothetical protein